MIISESYADINVPDSDGVMRVHIFRPVGDGGPLAAICVFTEIYQVTGPVQRLCRLLASEGFIAVCPESYHEFEAPGTVLSYNPADTDKGNEYKVAKTCSAYDRDARALLDYLGSRPDCNGRIGSIGMCLGGHLSLRCAFFPQVIASVCLFATDVHSGTLGKGGDDTMEKIRNGTLGDSTKTELVMIWGKQDSHCNDEGRREIRRAMDEAKVDFSWCEFNARHAFIRDELSKGRYDASITQVSIQLSLELFRRRLILGMPSMSAVTPQSSAPGPSNC